ncbi:MAG TPA: hypothetical protein VGL65_09545 [Gemmatimonadales bacterium]
MTRRKLGMAATVVDFIKQQPPSTDAGFNALVTEMEGLVTRSDDVARQQRDGVTAQAAATQRRDELSRRTLRDQMRNLFRIARRTAATNAEFAGHFVAPPRLGTLSSFITEAKAMLAIALPQKDLLLGAGLTATALDDLQASIDEFDDETVRQHDAQHDHISARAELTDIATRCVELSRALDGYFRLQFAGNPETLATWRSASNVRGHSARHPASAPTPEPAPQPAPAPVQPSVSLAKEGGA